jgi:hypothetical protein
MYIQKEVITHYGIPATYHTLKAIHTYYDMGISHIDIAGYFSKEAFDNNGNSIVVNQIEVNQASFENERDIYNAVLVSNIFQDGILIEE